MSERYVVDMGVRFVHPIYTGHGPRHNVIRAALNRLDSRPQHPDDITFKDCVAEFGAAACPCAHYDLEWPHLRVQERTGPVTESDVGRPDD